MKKIKQISLLALTFTFMFVIGFAGVKAAPNTITIKAADYTKDFINDNDSAMTMFTTTDGNTVYCMDIDKKALMQGMSATLVGDADASVLYILKNGYPKKTYKNNKGMDAYITQMALYWYLSESKLSSNFKNATGDADKYGLVASTKALLNDAKSAKDNQPKPSMTVNGNSGTMALTSDGKYFESVYMSAKITGANTYNVTLSGAPSNTVVVDEDGNIGATLNSGEKFKVRVPVAEVSSLVNIKVKFTAVGTISKAKIYKPADNSYQRAVGLYDESVTLTKDLVLTAKQNRVCEYTGGKYYDINGNETDKSTYEKQCKHVCEFTDNKYYGKDGTEVDQTTFNKECNASCEYIDGQYHGKDGSIVDKITFEKECNKTCEVVNNKYYGKNGTEVDKETYNKECGQEVTVPNTKANIIVWIIVIGVLLITSGTAMLINRNNLKTNKKA